jgi:CBS domain-containing protein
MNVETILAGKGRDVLTIAPDATIADAVAVLKARRVGAAVVSIDGKSVAGILSERDIVHGLAEHGAQALERRVDELMTRDVMTCVGGDTDREVLALMTERRFRHLPVVEDGVLAGIVSIGDVVKSRLDEIATEAEAMRDYISRG